jgi:arylsulfatase A-like enzyme
MESNKITRRTFLHTLGIGSAGLLLRSKTPLSGKLSAKPKRLPNIIFILADDLGWAELECYGNTFNETLNLDQLAQQGMRFTNAYAAAPVCSPYRAALMTGMYPARLGITDYLRPNDPKHLNPETTTIAEQLKHAGYTTGIIGKWHLTGYAKRGAKEFPPSAHGFDETILSENVGIGGGSYFHPYHFNTDIKKRLPGKEYLVDRCNLEAVEFIERHKDRPFFLFLSHYAVHTRLVGKPELVAHFEKKAGAGKGNRAKKNNPHLAAQLKSIDKGVGMIAGKLNELDLAQDTVLIFTSDNGGEDRVTSNAPLRAGKSTLYEGGIREPLIVRYPPMVPAGTICNTPTCNIDYYPTFCEFAQIDLERDPNLDGVSIRPLLQNPDNRLPRDTFYWHYPLAKPHFLGGRSTGAIRKGEWKLIEFFDTGELELYNLSQDAGETRNLADTLPKKTTELKQNLLQWRKTTNITIPADCRNYDPKTPRGKQQRKKK